MQLPLRSIPYAIPSLIAALAGCVSGSEELEELDEVALEDAVSELTCTARKVEAFSSAADEGRLVYAPDGREAYFHRIIDGRQTIMGSRRVNGQWTTPAIVSFSGTYNDNDPFVTPDGNTLFYSSFRPRPGDTEERPDTDLWKVTRTPTGWSAPIHLATVNGEGFEQFPSTTADGTLFFNSLRDGSAAWDLYAARRRGGGYSAPQRLPGAVNTDIWEFNPAPSPSGLLLAFASLDPDPAAPYSDVFFSVLTPGGYSARINAGPCVNTEWEEYHPSLDLARGRLTFVRNDPFSPNYPQGDFYEVVLPHSFGWR